MRKFCGKNVLEKIFSVGICMVICLNLSACQKHLVLEDEKFSQIRFSWWGKDERNEASIKSIKNFEQKNPSISVELEYGEFDQIKRKVKAEISSGTQADVMQINYDWLYEFSKDGEGFYDLELLSDYISFSNFTEEDLNYGRMNGKLNGIPISYNAPTFLYNKTLFDKYGLDIPKNWDEIFQAAEVMKKDDIYPLALSKKNFWLSCCAYNEQVSGNSTFEQDGSFGLTQQDLQRMLEFYMEIIDKKVAKRAENFTRSDFENGLSGAVVCWISDSSYYYDAASAKGFQVVPGDYPINEDAISAGWYIKPTSLYAIKKDTADAQAAGKLVEYLLNSYENASIVGRSNGMPISSSALETLEAEDMIDGIEYEAAEKMNNTEGLSSMCPYMENDEIIDIFTDACDSVYYGEKTLSEAAENAVLLMNQVLE